MGSKYHGAGSSNLAKFTRAEWEIADQEVTTAVAVIRAYNTVIRVSDGPIIACTDDDVIVPSDWLSRIVDAFDADPEIVHRVSTWRRT